MSQLEKLLQRGSALSLLTNFIELVGTVDQTTENDIKGIVDLMLNNGDIVFTDWNTVAQKIQASKSQTKSAAKEKVQNLFHEQAMALLAESVVVHDKSLIESVATESLSSISKELNVDKSFINIAALLKCKSDAEKELEKHYTLMNSELDNSLRSMINKYSKHFPENYQTILQRMM